MKPHLTCLVALALATTVHGAWQRVPQTGSRNANVLTSSAPVAVIESDKGIQNAQAFTRDDSAATVELKKGKSNLVIGVPSVSSFKDFRFTNDDTAGTVRVYQSSDLKNWEILGQTSYTATTRLVEVPLTGSQTQHLKVEFDLAVGGTVRAGILSSATHNANEFKLVKSKSSADLTKNPLIDLADGIGGAKILYINPTPANFGTEAFKENIIIFPATSSKYRTLVYDLNEKVNLKKLGSVYSKIPVEVSVFALDALPETQDWRGKSILNSDEFTKGKPAVRHLDRTGQGNFSITLDKPLSARYVVFQYNVSPSLASVTEQTLQGLVASFTGMTAPKPVNTGSGFSVSGLDVVTNSYSDVNAPDGTAFDPGTIAANNNQDADAGEGTGDPGAMASDSQLARNNFVGVSGVGGVRQSSGGVGVYNPQFGDNDDDDDDKDDDTPPVIPPTSP